MLDTGLISGQHESSWVLRPERAARPVAADDVPGALAEIERLCQVWGGAGQPLLPVAAGELPAPYFSLLEREQIDGVGGLQDVAVRLPWRVGESRPADHPVVLIAAHVPLDQWRSVEVVELSPEDPWAAAYAAVLGVWPEMPDAALSDMAFVRDDLRFEEVVPMQRQEVSGSFDDLLTRLSDRSVLTPRRMSGMYLAAGLEPDTSFMGLSEEVLPRPWSVRRAAGPNLIVLMSPGSVTDLALLWNLRCAHGDRRVLPIGLPVGAVDAAMLAALQEPGRATMFGFGGGRCFLTSTSLELEELQRLAGLGPRFEAVSYEQVLTFGPAPGRLSAHVTSWEDGRTRLRPLSESDLELLSVSKDARMPELVLDVKVAGRPLPADGTMRGTEWAARYQAGAAQVQVPQMRRQTVEVAWPSTWTCLEAVAHSRGLTVTESEAGLAAATLLRALGGVGTVRLLQHRPLIDLLYRMAERSGMSWWKNRWTAVHRQLLAAGADAESLESAGELLGRDDPAVAPSGEGRDVPFSDFVTALGGDAPARHWVGWSERRHLLVRGAQITCPHCRSRSWLPMGALPPPVTCSGCGRQIEQPYGPRDLPFTYRLGEPMRRVLDTDSLGHVLALHWFVELLELQLVGAHPGVTFVDASSGRHLGEADVLLLTRDGDLVPVEVKRRVAGIDGAVEKLDSLSDALGSPWDSVVVTQPARDCEALTALERRLPERPRVLLTDDQLHDDRIIWTLGANPFGWQPMPEDADRERQAAFVRRLAASDPEAPVDYVRETLLDEKLGGLRRDRAPSDGLEGPAPPAGR
jgi:hypothetical protein